MAEAWAAIYLALFALCLVMHVFSLPGNWVMLVLALIWKWIHPETMDVGWSFFILLFTLAAIGEILERASQVVGGQRLGATKKGIWGAFFGAIVGSIIGAGFLFGIGAIPGAFIGAYGGGLLMELNQGRPFPESHRAAVGSVIGTVLGMVVKLGIGVYMFVLAAPEIWPG